MMSKRWRMLERQYELHMRCALFKLKHTQSVTMHWLQVTGRRDLCLPWGKWGCDILSAFTRNAEKSLFYVSALISATKRMLSLS